MSWKRFAGLGLIILSGIIGWTNTITGAVIGASSNVNWIVVIVFFLGIILMSTAEREEGGLEKLFFKDSKGVVRINDFKGELNSHRQPAEQVLKVMHEYAKEEEMSETWREVLTPYVELARHQRDQNIGKPLKPRSEEEYADKFLKIWDQNYRPLIHGNIVPIPLDINQQGFVRVRHYTSSSRAERIAAKRKFGGEDSPRPLDQGKVFIELATNPILSQQEFVERYAITNKSLGEAYIELLVPEKDLAFQVNSRNQEREYFLKANSVENKKRVYRILSDVDVVKR